MAIGSAAAAPAIAMLKSIVVFLIVTVIAYGGILIWLKQRIRDRKTFWMYKQLLSLLAVLIMAAYVWWKTTHP